MARETLTKAFLHAWNAHDADAAAVLMTEDCVFEPSVGQFPWGDRFHGRDQVRTWALETFQRVPDIRWDPVRCIVGENHIVFEFQVTGTPVDAQSFDVYACDILTLRDDSIVAKRAYRKARP